MPLRWTSRADRDLDAIHAYIAADDPGAAAKMILRLINAVTQQLATFPAAGRAGRVPGTRELVIAGTPYIVIYRSQANKVDVLRVLHGARKWP